MGKVLDLMLTMLVIALALAAAFLVVQGWLPRRHR